MTLKNGSTLHLSDSSRMDCRGQGFLEVQKGCTLQLQDECQIAFTRGGQLKLNTNSVLLVEYDLAGDKPEMNALEYALEQGIISVSRSKGDEVEVIDAPSGYLAVRMRENILLGNTKRKNWWTRLFPWRRNGGF